MPKVFIALATYQGAEYLRPLLESIRRQSCAEWTLLARDDGSTDATSDILQELARRDARICVLDDGGGKRGAAGNFGLVMQRACDLGADYLFLADQDDVWKAEKLQSLLELLRRGETAALRPIARLVYSDLVVVDQRLRTVHPSFLAYARLRHGARPALRTLLGRSFVLGCASGMNRPLLELALPLPESIASHDWWVALCAAAAGEISYLPQATVWYRRHTANASGPAGFWAGFNPWRHSWSSRWESGYRSFRQSLDQALALRQRLEERAAPVAEETRQCLNRFCTLFEHPRPAWQRVFRLLGMGVPAIDLPRRFLYYLCVGAMSLPNPKSLSGR